MDSPPRPTTTALKRDFFYFVRSSCLNVFEISIRKTARIYPLVIILLEKPLCSLYCLPEAESDVPGISRNRGNSFVSLRNNEECWHFMGVELASEKIF